MKKPFILFLLALLPCLASAAKPLPPRIDPPNWWAGMANPSLQLQVHGPGMRNAEVALKPYPGVSIDSIARLDGSQNYLFLYLNVSPEAKPGNLELTFTQNGKKQKIAYPLKERKVQKGAKGFSAADVLYMVMPDRFADGNPANNVLKSMANQTPIDRSAQGARHGGDLKGILDHTAYLDSLGITALWLNPVLENDMPGGSYHGYATTDYYRIDPRFGTNEEYTILIDSLHNMGIKTVMDMIFNHSGSEHPWIKDLPSSDWLNFGGNYVQTNYKLASIEDPYALDQDKLSATDGWFVREMPDLNQRNPHLMKYLVQNSIWWIEESQIDGIRMDTYAYADVDAMRGWVEDVLAQYPEFNIVGECWLEEPFLCARWQKGSILAPEGKDSGLPSVMDFPFMRKSAGMAPYLEQTDAWNGLAKIAFHVANDRIYADPMNLMRFVDNHDTDRFLLEDPKDLDAWKQAMTILLTLPGIPQLYYGTELLMSGDKSGGDGNVRKDMPGGFPGDTTDAFSREGRTPLQNEAFDFLSALLKWRKGSKAIATGQMRHLQPTGPIYAYRRFTPSGEEALVILNGSDDPAQFDPAQFSGLLTPGKTYRNVLTGADQTISSTLSLPPRAILILE